MKPPRSPRVLCTFALLTGFSGAVMPDAAQAAVFRAVANVAPGHVAWIYLQPDVASPRVGYLKAGALKVRTRQCKRLVTGGWCQVVGGGTRGWVQDRFLKAHARMIG